jgi:hypothetical protein
VRRIKVSVLANGPARSAGDRGDNLSENQKKITQGIRTRCRFFAKAPLVGAFSFGRSTSSGGAMALSNG